ncbi:MAG: GreA/GreB family elongation factor, partial [candidate division WOR-3 bacterium]
IARLIDSLEQINGIKPMILKILNLEAFDRLIGQTTLEDARRILASLKNSSTLADWEKRNFIRIIEFHFPQLFKKDDDVIYATKESLNKKKEELQRLLTVEIPENKREISRAREYGDLSENFEYKVAREKQDQLYQKVRDLESALLKTKIIDPATIDIHKVSVGTKVTLEAKKDQTRVSYTILGRWDTNLDKNIISNEAPLARHLLGKTVGAMIKINDLEYEIVAIEKAL